jgi:SHS2 domain-containing protein
LRAESALAEGKYIIYINGIISLAREPKEDVKESMSRKNSRYQITPHEADTGLTIFGRCYEDLFSNGAYALFSLLFDLRKVRRSETKRFSISDDRDALIVFLNELLYLWDVHRFIPKRVTVVKDGATLNALIEGETFDSERHLPGKEVKAATYHGFSLVEYEDGMEARLILDI